MTDFAKPYSSALASWESVALLELRRDYRQVLLERKLKLQPCLIELTDSAVFWGRWNATTRTIELSRNLVQNENWHKVRGVLLHEMAHQLVSEVLDPAGADVGHGLQFKMACQKLGVPHPFDRAAIDLRTCELDWRQNTEMQDATTNFLIQRVQKLLALAQSSNEFEAKSAVRKVQEIYALYNLDSGTSAKDQIFHIHIETSKKKIQGYAKRILGILMTHFYVHVIVTESFSVRDGDRSKVIELIGRRENVLMAEYVYHFLLNQAEILLQKAMSEGGKPWGPVVRKSFRMGVMAGFDQSLSEPVHATPSESQTIISRSLMVFQNDRELGTYIEAVFPRLRKLGRAQSRVHSSAFHNGVEQGRALRLKKSMHSSSSFSDGLKLLTRN